MASHLIRLLGESKNAPTVVPDVLTKEVPFWWRGVDLSIAFAISQNGQFLMPGDIGTLHVAVKDLEAAADDPVRMLKSIEAVDVDAGFTPELWESGDKSLATAEFTREEAALEAGRYRIIIIHIDPNGNRNTHLHSEIEVKEDQYDSVLIVAPLPLNATEEVTALLAAIEENGDLVELANANAQAAVDSANAAQSAAAAAALTIADVTAYVFQRAVCTVEVGFDEFLTPVPHAHLTMGNLGIYFVDGVNGNIGPGDYANFTAPKQIAIEITGETPDSQHAVAQMIVALINGTNIVDDQFGLNYVVDDYERDENLYARYLGATGPEFSRTSLRIFFLHQTQIA